MTTRRGGRRTFGKVVRRAITGNPARFMAIFGIVAIGAGVFAGLRAFVPDMYISADAFYDAQDCADLQVMGALGLTADDVDAIAEAEGVERAMGVASYETVMAREDGTALQVQVEAVPMAIYEDGPTAAVNRPIVREGRLPQAPGEIVFSSNGHLKDEDVALGDRLVVRSVMGIDDVRDVYAQAEFTVVGLVTSPEYLSVSTGLSPTSGARITNYAWVDRSSMADPGLFTAVVATVEGARDEAAFSDAYDERVAPVRAAVKRAAGVREQARYEELLARADDAVAQAQGLADAAGRIDRALALLDDQTDARELLGGDGSGAAMLLGDDRRAALLAALESAAVGRSVAVGPLGVSIDGAAPVSVADLAADLLAQAQDVRDALAPAPWYVLTRDANPSYYVYKATALRMDRICLIFPVFFFLVAGLVSLTTMGRMVANDRVEIGTLEALGYGRAAIAAKYLAFSGLASTLGALAGIAAGSYALPLAIWTPYSVMYAQIPFYLGPRLPGAAVALGLSVGLTLAATLAAIARVLREPTAALMLPAAPKRGRRILLERVRPLWGRMGFSQKVAARNLMRYKGRMAMTVVGVAGCCGLALCGFGVQDRLNGFVEAQYGGIYAYDLLLYFDADADPLAAAGSAGAPLAATLDGELGTGRWTYLLKRACVAANHEGDPDQIPYGVGGRLDKTGGSVQAEIRSARSDADETDAPGILRDATLYVLPDGCNQPFIAIDDVDGAGRLTLPGQGAASHLLISRDGEQIPGCVVTQRLAEQLMVGVGDAIEVACDGRTTRLAVGGVMRNLVGHFVYLAPAAYAAAFGLDADDVAGYNAILAFAPSGLVVEPGSADAEALKDRLQQASSAVTSVALALEESDGYEDIAASLNSIVVILLGVSGMLAFIVVFALTQINIEERRREIATLKVLGFMPGEVRGYVYRETYVLAGAGILCGLPFGAWLCDFVMRAAEFDNVIYFRSERWWCFVVAAVLTAAVVALVTLAMRRRLAAIEMVGSLKSVD